MHRGKVRKPRQWDIGVFLRYGAVGKPHLPRIEGQKGEYTRRNEVGKPRQQRKVRSLGIGATQGSVQYAPCLGRRGRILARIGVVGSVRICRLCQASRREHLYDNNRVKECVKDIENGVLHRQHRHQDKSRILLRN